MTVVWRTEFCCQSASRRFIYLIMSCLCVRACPAQSHTAHAFLVPVLNNTGRFYFRTPRKLMLWSRTLIEKLIVPQLVKNLPAFYKTQKFIMVFTSCHLSASETRCIQSTPSHPVSSRSILISCTPRSYKWSVFFHVSTPKLCTHFSSLPCIINITNHWWMSRGPQLFTKWSMEPLVPWHSNEHQPHINLKCIITFLLLTLWTLYKCMFSLLKREL